VPILLATMAVQRKSQVVCSRSGAEMLDTFGIALSAGGDSTQHTWSLSSATERQAATGKGEVGCDGATPVIRACEQRAADRARLEAPDADLARLIRAAEAQ
jgi:hypothetical protein